MPTSHPWSPCSARWHLVAYLNFTLHRWNNLTLPQVTWFYTLGLYCLWISLHQSGLLTEIQMYLQKYEANLYETELGGIYKDHYTHNIIPFSTCKTKQSKTKKPGIYYNSHGHTASKWLNWGLNAGWLTLKSALWTVGFMESAIPRMMPSNTAVPL